MRAILINPSAPNIASINTGGFDLPVETVGKFPPLGIMSIATYINKVSRHKVDVLDCDAGHISEDEVVSLVRGEGYKVVGLTAFTYTFYDVMTMVRKIRQQCPSSIIVIGGPHIQLFPEETLRHPEVDFIAIGEGEEMFLSLLDNLEKGREVKAADGIGFRVNDSESFVGAPAKVDDLDKLPFPDYSLVNPDHYHATFGSGGKTITMNTTRGCPFRCTFCQVLVKSYRTHSIEYTIDHIRHFYDQGYRNFYFFDDLFNINEKRTLEFSMALKSSGMKIHWIFRGRAPSLTDEVCHLVAETGCVQILLGVEDFCDENLKAIKKGIKMKHVRSAITNAARYKILTSTNWIIGLPTHKSEEDLKSLIKVALETGGDYAMFGILQLLPGCEMYDDAVKEGVLSVDDWRDYTLNPVPSYQIQYYDKYLTPVTLTQYYEKAYKSFYRRPSYILKKLGQITSLRQLLNQVPVALHILFGKRSSSS